MPTETGGETIDERLARLRAEQVAVRATIDRHHKNGQRFDIGGTSVTEIAYERAIRRERQLQADIIALEARLTGSLNRSGMTTLATRGHR